VRLGRAEEQVGFGVESSVVGHEADVDRVHQIRAFGDEPVADVAGSFIVALGIGW
jgi:hypothetical protein